VVFPVRHRVEVAAELFAEIPVVRPEVTVAGARL
jgi:hypothetical protein